MKSTEKNIYISIKNDISQLNKVNKIFEQFINSHNIALKISNPISLAMDEIVNNIISYGYDDQKDHEIEIYIELSERSLKLQIEDDGFPFNPLQVKDADVESNLDERVAGGVGLHLIKNMMDSLNYEFINNKNCLTLEKYIKET